ncbi:MAG: hypothetical protein HY938_08585 [Nitrosomonadales bacterium]|nr:hypothetical protein [Nitrosomonadales bacterium]
MKAERLSKELLEVRSRLFVKDWQAVIFDVGFRLRNLREAVVLSDSPEMYRHAPVAVIAALETYFRGTVIHLINRGEPYRSRVADLVKEKIVIRDAISFFHGEDFTFGEVIAKSASCNSISDIHIWLEKLLDIDLKSLLGKVIDPYHKRNGFLDAPFIINDVETLYRNTEEAFRLRHIFAHEAAAQLVLNREDALRIIDSIRELTDGIDAVLWVTAYADLPLTQAEMTQHAYRNYQEEYEKLQTIIAHATKVAESNGIIDWFIANQRSWELFCKDWVEGGYRNQTGSMWPSVATSEHANLIRQRAEALKGWISSRGE